MFYLLWVIIVGLIGGIIGKLTKASGLRWWVATVLGILGAFVGSFITRAIGLWGWYPIIAGLIGAMIVTVVGGLVTNQGALRARQNPSSREQSAGMRSTESRGNVIDRPAPIHSAAGNIFISYASPDRPAAEALAKALLKEGWSVWWDRTIPPGKSFDEVIEAALSAAKCVIVLWSRASVASDWVKVEASDAAKRKILIPALIEEVTIPLEFRRIQSASLVDWRGASPHPGFDALLGSVASIVGTSKASATSI
jgi:uncharacterized membrane protein YeaQ/YmgE (transglycosylase-associated protein family)